ncbi:MAG: diguanylate cyclase [Candidatus Eisenbacteria bacterium]|nr:diguanylate cyclase [Candidatus Eisenbacteria bacterium]
MKGDDLFERVFESLYDGAYVVDTDRCITHWNRAAEKLSGYKAKDVVGSHCQDDILEHVDADGRNLCKGDCPLAKTLRDGRRREVGVFLHHKKGHRVPVLIRVSPIHDQEGSVVGAVEVFSDNSASVARTERLRELERMSLLDELTGLPSRACLERELETRVAELERFGRVFGVILMDVDHLGETNRLHGRDVGDDLLRMVGQTLLYNTRALDLVGRWDGGRFLCVVLNVERRELAKVAHRFQSLVAVSTLPLGSGEQVATSISVGASIAKWGDSVAEILSIVDGMLKQSKRMGRNRVTVGG